MDTIAVKKLIKEETRRYYSDGTIEFSGKEYPLEESHDVSKPKYADSDNRESNRRSVQSYDTGHQSISESTSVSRSGSGAIH